MNKAIHDFEDGLEYYTALEKDCKSIITEDQNDLYFQKLIFKITKISLLNI